MINISYSYHPSHTARDKSGTSNEDFFFVKNINSFRQLTIFDYLFDCHSVINDEK